MHPLRRISLAVLLSLAVIQLPAQVYIGNLDGSSTSSTFEVASSNLMPTLGWTTFSGAAQQFQNTFGNGSVIAQAQFANYAVQYNTGATLLADSIYTLSFRVGFVSAGTTGTATYSAIFGTSADSGATITALSVNSGAATAVIDRASGGPIQSSLGASSANSQLVTITFLTGASVNESDPLFVRWAQTNSTGTMDGQDYFGFDNVTLSVAAIPEPSTYAAIFGVVALGGVMVARRRRTL